jgi:rhodanese-related sulfurtransferase
MERTFSERVAEAKAAVAAISAREAAALRGGCEEIIFVDPRPADAIAATTGLIPGANNVPLGEITAGRLPPAIRSKHMRLITACQGGPMGAIAAHELMKLGYRRVSFIDGGTQAWLDAGLATVR